MPQDRAGRLTGVRKIAVLRPNAVGDFVFALPALHALKRAYPGAELVLLGLPWHAAFLANRPGPVDRVLEVPPLPGIGLAPDAPDRGAWGVFVEAMRAEEVDLACQMYGGGRYANPLVGAFGARLTIGARADGAAPLDRWVRYTEPVNRRLALLDIAALAGARELALGPELAVTEQDRRAAARVLGEVPPAPSLACVAAPVATVGTTAAATYAVSGAAEPSGNGSPHAGVSTSTGNGAPGGAASIGAASCETGKLPAATDIGVASCETGRLPGAAGGGGACEIDKLPAATDFGVAPCGIGKFAAATIGVAPREIGKPAAAIIVPASGPAAGAPAVVGAAAVSTLMEGTPAASAVDASSGAWRSRRRGQAAPPLVLLQPGSTDPRRCWPAECFAAVGDALAAQGARIAVNGTAAEAPLVRRVRDAMRAPAFDLSGKLDLGGLCGVIERAGCVVSNDTGPLHLALAIGTPGVGIFWLTNLIDGMPLRPHLLRAALSLRQDCPVCGLPNLRSRCGHDVSFVADVPVEQVVALASDVLALTPAARD